jgi:signal transduction histidine kinase
MEKRILVYAPLGQDAILAEKVLRGSGIEVGRCSSAVELADALGAGAGALLLVEEVVAALGPALRHLEQQPAWSDLPVMVMAKHGADSLEAQRAVQRLGNVTLLERPVRTATLISAARSALRARERQYQVRTLNRRKDEFLATLAHELRNPLAPIRNAMAIVERLHPTPDIDRLAGMVDRQVSHLQRLMDDLLDMARITNGKVDLRVSRTTVAEILTHALEIAEATIREKAHRLTIQQPGETVVLQADHVRVVQTVANLLVNAAKFTPPSGSIDLTVQTRGPMVEFRVRDSGKGIGAASLERIFDMFAQAREIGEPSAGLGIGLHLAKAFAELHGGTVVAHSDGAGKGSEFVLSLPVVMEADAVRPAQPGDAGFAGKSPGKVLVVDDNVDAASTLAALLGLQGIAVSVAYDGAAAVAAVQRDKPDAVVMDIGMPVMNGYDAARRIRGEFGEREPVLIALTGWGQFADKQRAKDAGFDSHLVKPVDFQELISCLARRPVTG